MATVLSRMCSPAPLLYSFVVITQFAYGIYLGAQLELPPAMTFLYWLGFLWALVGGCARTAASEVSRRFTTWILSVYRVAGRNALLSRQDSWRKGLAFYFGFYCRLCRAEILGIVLSVS